VTADEAKGAQISKRYGNDFLKIGMDILMNININRVNLDNSNTDLYVIIENNCLNLIGNIIYDVVDLSDQLIEYKCNNGILIHMFIDY